MTVRWKEFELVMIAMEKAKEFSWMRLKLSQMMRSLCFSHALVGWLKTSVMEKLKEKFILAQDPHTHQVTILVKAALNTVKPLISDTCSTQSSHYYGQFVLSLRNKNPYIFSKFTPITKNKEVFEIL